MTSENAHNGTDLVNERHYTPQEVADILHIYPQTVVRLFRRGPAVIEFGSDENRFKRKRKFLLIPKSVLERFHEKPRIVR